MVDQHDITKGLPFADNHFDGVYHSHVLEHLEPSDGEKLLDECYRVLRPGGVLRIVVPNLEQIATLYLNYHREAWAGDEGAAINYNWMKLELLDQLVRSDSGGAMGRYMAGDEIKNSGFVRSRVGDEFSRCQDMGQGGFIDKARELTIREKTSARLTTAKQGFTRWVIRKFMGKDALRSFDEGLFRNQGEIHRWMYDRYSLKELCIARGFTDFKVQSATDSSIADYESFELDSEDGNIRKPDSLFVECKKNSAASMMKAA
jgi:SAM-dependent methyltransferase